MLNRNYKGERVLKMTERSNIFVTALMADNLALAWRCAAQPDVWVSEDTKASLRQALMARAQDHTADLRARIAAGLALGVLGDPRLQRHPGPHGDYLLPPLITLPSGTYPIGSDEGHYDDETPAHPVDLQSFQLGQFPVTNAEYALFLKAGGYEDARWWDTEAAQAWRRGESTAEGTNQPGRQTQPDFWNNTIFNNPAQPVVGICWYEARAYCAWLSAQTGQVFRLPTEAEWEAAARGPTGRRYAYGNDFDATRCNTFETHIRRTTPVGIFPGGETPEKLIDMTGNTWDWTSSLYQPYPYRATDGREDPADDARRVVRGGSWLVGRTYARAAYRDYNAPGYQFSDVGFRLACSSLI